MNKLYGNLQEIKKRPGLYLEEKSLSRLDSFILGYCKCESDLGIEKNILFDGFQEFVQEKYGIKSHSASQIISFYSISKSDAFDKFYSLLDEFLQLHPENLEWYLSYVSKVFLIVFSQGVSQAVGFLTACDNS